MIKNLLKIQFHLILSFFLVISCTNENPLETPNILLIMADDIGFSMVDCVDGCYMLGYAEGFSILGCVGFFMLGCAEALSLHSLDKNFSSAIFFFCRMTADSYRKLFAWIPSSADQDLPQNLT